MVEDFTLNLHAGGRHRCTPAWDRANAHDKTDQCYKVYLPLSGQAFVANNDEEFSLTSGRLYFISGYALKSQRCPANMDVRWLHFTPVSFYLDRCLRRMPMLESWPVKSFAWSAAAFGRVEELFENAASASESHLARRISMALACRLEAALLQLLAELLETHKGLLEEQHNPELELLRPAIRHMDERFLDNPSLEEVAAKVHLAPTYFHRLFQKATGTTPLAYITARRMEMAHRLLADPRKQIKHIAEECGYEDPFYFSRVYFKHFGVSPTAARNASVLGP